MSEEQRIRYFIRNQRNQPVELHLSSGLLVLGPWAESEVSQGALSEPQVKVFHKNRLLTTREAPEPVAEPSGQPEQVSRSRARSAKSADQNEGAK